jgi:hypothetical protein
MPYGGRTNEAEIRHEKIFIMGREEIFSPSVLASKIANGTSRNAWRDLRVKRPSDREFRLADELRSGGAGKRIELRRSLPRNSGNGTQRITNTSRWHAKAAHGKISSPA